MGIPIIGDIIDAVGDIISEVVVDKDKRNEIRLELARLKAEGDARVHEEILAQIEVNKTEAQHGSIFVAGWRPFVGWVSGFGVAYATILQPLISWIARLSGYTGDFPPIDSTLLLYVLGGMLGISGMRSFEKVKGVSTNDFRDVPVTVHEDEATPVGPAPKVSPKPRRRFKL